MTDLSDLIARVEASARPDRDLMDRIERSVEFDPFGGCWLWADRIYLQPPYGRARPYITINGRQWLAHRASYMAATGRDPGIGYVCHHCDNPWCVNPAHLYLGDHRSNMDDMRRRRRYFAATQPERAAEVARRLGRANTWHRGEANPRAKLAEAEVLEIRESNEPTKQLAARFRVHRTIIQRIRKGTLWKNF